MEDIRRTTGTSRQYVRSNQVPLAGVVPLRRTNFSTIPPQNTAGDVSGGFQQNVSPQGEAASEYPITYKKPQPVYAATFHGGKKKPTNAYSASMPVSESLAASLPLENFPLSRYEAPEDRKLVVKPKNWFKLTSRLVAMGIAAVFLLSGFFAWHSYASSSNGHAEAASGTAILSAAKVSPEKLTEEGDARINILLLGIGGEGHTGADLSDTIMLASIDPVNKTSTLLSIPRDLWVKLPNQHSETHQKINAVYSAGKSQYYRQQGRSDEKAAVQAGLAAVDSVVEQVLGVPIQYHAMVDFKAFKQAVDAVGNITLDVKAPLVDPTMAWENGGNATLARAGVQEMDGATALRYVRSRHTSSDFARSMRQREVLIALRNKILTTSTLANPLKLQQLIATFGDNVFTDMSTLDIVRLYGITHDIEESAITSIDLATGERALVATDTVGSTSVVRPKLGFDRYSDIQTYVRSQLRDGYLVKERAGVVVAAGSEETANKVKATLTDLGYNVLSTTASRDVVAQKTTVVDLSNGLSPYTRHYLDKRYGGSFTESLPKGLVVPDGTQFVILVGT